MSSTIEFSRYVLKSTGAGQFGEPLYFGVHETGSRNVVTYDGTIARSTSICEIATGYEFMAEIVKRAVHCEGGMLNMNGRWCKPEGYIAAWRKAQAEALELEHYLEHGNCLIIEFHSLVKQLKVKMAAHDQTSLWGSEEVRKMRDLIIKLCTTEGIEEAVQRSYGEDYPLTTFTLTNANSEVLLSLLGEVIERVRKPNIWRARFSLHAWSMGKNAQTVEAQNKEKVA